MEHFIDEDGRVHGSLDVPPALAGRELLRYDDVLPYMLPHGYTMFICPTFMVLYLRPDADANDLYRYISYVIGSSFGSFPRVMFKENRIAFRLGWIRANFPSAGLGRRVSQASDDGSYQMRTRRAGLACGRAEFDPQRTRATAARVLIPEWG
jgi:hypothetical protein